MTLVWGSAVSIHLNVAAVLQSFTPSRAWTRLGSDVVYRAVFQDGRHNQVTVVMDGVVARDTCNQSDLDNDCANAVSACLLSS